MTTPEIEEPYVPPNPFVVEFRDYVGKVIRLTANFNEATRALTGAVAFRDADCQYRRVYIGLGPDGAPDSTPDVVPVPAGTTSVSANQLRRNGLRTIEDVTALQITAGP